MPTTKDSRKTKPQLIAELNTLRKKLDKAATLASMPAQPLQGPSTASQDRIAELEEANRKLRVQLADQRNASTTFNLSRPALPLPPLTSLRGGRDRWLLPLVAVLGVICLLLALYFRFGVVGRLEQSLTDAQALVERTQEKAQRLEATTAELRAALTPQLVERVPFDSGRVSIGRAGLVVLRRAAPELHKATGRRIRIVGYSDNAAIPPQTAVTIPAFWDLSVSRASAVARYLIAEAGIAADRIEVSGQGPGRSMVSTATEDSRQKKRRVEIYLVGDSPSRTGN